MIKYLLTVCLVTYLLLQSVTSQSGHMFGKISEADTCMGTSRGAGSSGSNRSHYLALKRMYTNCSYVIDNIEISMPELYANETLDFFKNIREVNGYIRISGPFPPHVKKLPFDNLMIIRGNQRASFNTQKDLALLIVGVQSVETLGFSRLHEISSGNVYIALNYKICHGDTNTIDWTDIFQKPEQQRAVVNITMKKNCYAQCHPSCDGHCWGPGEMDCQVLNKEECADQCEYRCYGNKQQMKEPQHCCSPQCAAGCDGPTEDDCWGCRNFYDSGTCVSSCPADQIYNSNTMRNEDNPDAKKAFGKLCLESCPNGYFEENGGCILHGCSSGYTDIDNICVKCNGTCPQACNWNFSKVNYITADILNQPQYQNCTIIQGNVPLLSGGFSKKVGSDMYQGKRAITVQDLEVFRTVEKITGFLHIQIGNKLPGLTDLSVFSNLKEVKGAGDSYGLQIVSDHVTALEMTSLQSITSGHVWIKAPLCYTRNDSISKLMPNFGTQKLIFDVNRRPPQICDGKSCNSECADDCWGPDDTMCMACKNFRAGDRCITDCNEPGLFQVDNTTCGFCHEQCAGGCTGPLDTDCISCENYKVQSQTGNRCVDECPLPFYSNETRECLPCHENCKLEITGCTGPLSILGAGGCNSCPIVELDKSKTSVVKCLPKSMQCQSGFFQTNQKPQKLSTQNYTLEKMCIPCFEECASCQYVENFCSSCKHYQNYQPISPPLSCVESCRPRDYVQTNAGKNICMECHSSCKTCNGSTEFDCLTCYSNRLYTNESSFMCVSDCPKISPDSIRVNGVQMCSLKPTTGSITDPADNMKTIGISVGLSVLVIVVIVVVIAVYCTKRRTKVQRDAVQKYIVNQPEEPINITTAEPDLSRLKLIKESELKKSTIIGSGAFGTVFKGYWVPDGDNVKIPVAIKVLIDGSSPAMSTELLDEARVMASVDNPYCIKILAVCMAQQLQLVTQLMPNGCLLTYVKSKNETLGSKVLLNWCAQIAKGMQYLESRGIVHRDLAARNVLVRSENEVKITDFGLARLLDVDENFYLAESGKLPIKWMALESIQHRKFTHQTDVWSYGVTIWEILTYGAKPYDTVKARDIALLLERGERLSQPRICTIDLYMIMIKCWMLDGGARPCFTDLEREFVKMARDPGRYLVIEGDNLRRVPTIKPHEYQPEDLATTDGESWDNTAELQDKTLMSADDYIPSFHAPHRYENESAAAAHAPLFLDDKQETSSAAGKELPSPLRYTSSPTLYPVAPSLHPDSRPGPPVEDYLEPISSKPSMKVDEDGYLEPNSQIPGSYVDINGHASPSSRKKNYPQQGDQSDKPLLSADNCTYMSAADTPVPNNHVVNNPTYVSNNNGSPITRKPPNGVPDYVNQPML